ncbi:relaxase domain-containing protein [Kribbella sandramycini]|uniref:Conjugative relaxase-like TrwC/TraI family protein n=2 Tax=Kribbella sandramycini TaxID=60450 RepID=A0A7Y4L6W1_9ACTN|nr:conjugative relaxase-like TrwC/TraI family protein [Kribbella sandramycini]NOL45474.1 relaxase domain-containing protein [Kribbella sandramycini]
MTAGDGYNYLLKHVASGDLDRRMATPLTAYYASTGYPPGRWLGSGLPGLGDGTLAPGTEVTESQMAALFGRAQDPLDGRQLGRPYPVYKSPSQRIQEQIRALDPTLDDAQRQTAIRQIHRTEMRTKTQHAVAGFDFTFSPAKSVSALWAISDIGTQEQIVAAHNEAVDQVVSLIEKYATFSRTGEQGIAQIDTRGLLAAAFDHWDTRSGDPQLHTHVVVANRVQGKDDGVWRTLDSRVLHRATVAMSEIHNVLLADNLTRRVGVNWELRDRGERRNPSFEIDAIPDALIKEFSARTEQIESNLTALLDAREDQLPPPTRREMYVLRQQATLINRPPKHHARPLIDLMAEWAKRADQAVGSDVVAAIRESLDQREERPLAAADLSPETIDAYGAATVLTLQLKRATWTRWNLLAEAARQTRLLRFASADDRMTALEAVVTAAERHSISLTAPTLVSTPLTRDSGESVFTIHNGQIYTSPVILGAESALLDLARDTTGPRLHDRQVRSDGLSPDKVRALHRIAASGQKVEALVGPAGTGKTTLLATLVTNWQAAYGDGSIIALAPSSAASTILSDAIGTPAENIAKWVYESAGLGAETRRQHIHDTARAADLAHDSWRKRRHQRLTEQLAALRAEDDRWTFHPNQLVIVDEASMAGTMELAILARAANTAGAKLLLVGDDAQLGAADTGGAFRLIAQDTTAAELSDVWRFTHPWEREASLALRTGELQVIDTYDNHDRLTAGPNDQMEEAAYQAWLADTRAGKSSLLIAADNTTVARLNARARLDRITTGEVEPDGLELHDGTHVGLGDHIVTRLNNRRLRHPEGYVQNGDHWTVIHRWPDGSLTVQNPTGHTVTLPATYVQQSVELAYATTTHRAQGTTVDTAHLVVTDHLTRALLYVGLTRGRHSNHAYIATHQPTPDVHEPHYEQTMQDVLEAVLTNPGVELSAHEVLRQQLDNATRLDRLVPIYEHLCQLDARTRITTALTTSGLPPTDQAAVQASPAYGALVSELRRGEDVGLASSDLLRRSVSQARLADAHDVAAVLHARVSRLVARAARGSGRLPTTIAGIITPAHRVNDPSFIGPLRELETQISLRADWLAENAPTQFDVWFQEFSRLTADYPASQRTDILRRVCAYRERYAVRDTTPLGKAPSPAMSDQHLLYASLLNQLTRPAPPPRTWTEGDTKGLTYQR